MPGFYTHHLCGKRTLEAIAGSPLRSMLSRHMQLYSLGAQGPDIFFYYGFWPWVKSKQFHDVGEQIHAQNVNAFFSNGLDYILEANSLDRDALTAYLCGYACHYSLDSNTHPYVFYKTGFVRKDEKYTSKYTYYHRLFETTLDFLLVQKAFNCRPSDIDGRSLVRLSSAESSSVGRMFRAVLKKTFGIDIDVEQVQKAIKDMGLGVSVLRDRTGLKRRLISGLESTLSQYPLLSSMIPPLRLSDSLDYLNEQHSSWSLPWDKEATSNSSFEEMFDKAVSEATQMCEAIYGSIHGSLSKEEALSILGNRSFSTGVDCDAPLEFCFFDCIY